MGTNAAPGGRTHRIELLERAGAGRLFRGDGPVVDATATDPGQTIHVAPDGETDAEGTADDPFGSLEGARDAVGARRGDEGLPDGGVEVVLAGGTYRRESAFELGPADGGEPGAPVTYRAAAGEEARLVGSVALDPDGFEPVSGDARERIPEAAREHVLEYDLAADGLTDLPTIPFRGDPAGPPDRPPEPELFVDGKAMSRPRYPNEGWVAVQSVDASPLPEGGDPPDEPTVFEYGDERPEEWASLDDVWVFGYWSQDWGTGTMAVRDIDPERNRLVTGPHSPYGEVSPADDESRRIGSYYYLNVLDELDRPGDFYVDREADALYLYPPEDADLADASVELSLLDEPLVTGTGVDNLTLRGLTFETSRGDGLELRGGDAALIHGCTFRNLGGRAAVVGERARDGDGGEDADGAEPVRPSRSGLLSCDVRDVGKGGVVLRGGDRPSLSPAGNFVLNCEIADFARVERAYSPAVSISGVGNRVAHNEAYGSPHQGFSYGGNDHVIERNHVHHVVQEASDAGAIYTCRSWSQRGTVIRENYIHDVDSGQAGSGQMGIYVDDLMSGMTVVRNVIHRVDRGFMFGGGRDSDVRHNLVLDADKAIRFDARGAPGHWRDYSSDEDSTLMEGLREDPYREEPWRSHYPSLAVIRDDEPALPRRNELAGNVFHSEVPPNVDAEVHEHSRIGPNAVRDAAADPGVTLTDGLLDAPGGSPVRETVPDWVPIPVAAIGLRPDDAVEDRPEADRVPGALRDALGGAD
jgi:hypothetical protein